MRDKIKKRRSQAQKFHDNYVYQMQRKTILKLVQTLSLCGRKERELLAHSITKPIIENSTDCKEREKYEI